MATLGGDLIRMLAHGGISTLGNVGAQLLSNYLKPGMEVRELAGKTLLGTLGTGSEEETNAAAQALESDYGVKWPTATRTNPAGVEVVSPEGAKLTAPRASLNDLAPGVTPQMGLVRPAPALEAIKSKILTGLTPEEQKTAAFPKDASLQAALIKAQGDWAVKESEGALNRGSREDIAKTIAGLREDQMAQTKLHQQSIESLQRERLEQQRKVFGLVVKKVGDENLIKHSNLINQAWDDYEKAASSKVKDPNRVAAAVDKYNNLIDVAEQRVPELAGNFSKLTPEMVQTWGEWARSELGTKVKGFKVAPKGGAPKATTPTPVVTTPTLSAIQEEKRRRGLIK